MGQKPKEEMPQYWALSDIALVLLRKSDLFKTVIPSKIFEAMAMRKPIVLGVEGESRDIIERADSGVAIPPEDASALCDAVIQLSNAELAAEKGNNGKVFVSEYFDRNKLAERYLTCDVFTRAMANDALHVAAAVLSRYDVVLSWNFRHLVNRRRRALINEVNTLLGLPTIEIVAPAEL